MATANDITVIIPLYNKSAEIERTLRSVVAQSVQPRQIIVVDDGSTDDSAAIVERMAISNLRLIRQENRGVSAARNRAMREAETEWVALLDGDDVWREHYLATIVEMLRRWPECGAYATGFYIDDGKRLVVGTNCGREGIVDFFKESMTSYVLIPSATTLRRELALALGGFPEGMRMGEDQYLWTKIARSGDVAFTPQPQVIYSRAASNRSASIYRAEQSRFSLEELYDERCSPISNEYVARVALGKALVESTRGGTEAAARALHFFAYNTLSKRIEHKLRLLNALPCALRPTVMWLYNTLAWVIARKGL